MEHHQKKVSENKIAVTAANRSGTNTVQLKDNREHSVVQRVLKVDVTNPEYTRKVTEHLRELVGETGKIIVNSETGEVSFLPKRRNAEKVTPTPGHSLIRSLVNHTHTTIIKESLGADSLSSQPILPDNSLVGKAIDWFKDFQYMKKKGYLTHEARAFVNGATPGVGVGTIVHYDANLSDKDREGEVRLPNGKTKRESSPQSISLGHELIHSDHFHRGLGAYDEKGMPILSSRQHTYSDFPRGETTNLEEINTVGLDTLPPEHKFHKHIIDNNLAGNQTYQINLQDRDRKARNITEQDLRKQMNLLPRAGYER
ncbi:M91 family zinc metallopeptidase [Flavobacterium sp. N3904]|uniref:M91 family zinc metallopeptidase n=1 Tax=Flavobacterium sp. N3904 TaxID=2986835 RepID=UPI0022240FA3|nr:M91 family zinc metallopeptidase [Flavobacterium sp. N3904]